jgi:hypothetical protein
VRPRAGVARSVRRIDDCVPSQPGVLLSARLRFERSIPLFHSRVEPRLDLAFEKSRRLLAELDWTREIAGSDFLVNSVTADAKALAHLAHAQHSPSCVLFLSHFASFAFAVFLLKTKEAHFKTNVFPNK